MGYYDVAVIGAGPAGLFCAIHAAASGARVIVLEKNKKPGAKLLLSGSGQCNLTHAGDIRSFLSHYGSHGKFIKPALLSYPNTALLEFFTSRGLAMVQEENGKIFPATRRSEDVLGVLLASCNEHGVTRVCGSPVTSVVQERAAFTITTDGLTCRAGTVAITTGGASYPKCGTTGDGYRLAESLGQPVTPVAPALTPLIIRPFPFTALAGLSFAGMRFGIWRGNTKVREYHGDVLITHHGLSGPGILDASRDILAGDEIRLAFAGTMRRDELSRDLLLYATANPNQLVRMALARYHIPERLVRVLARMTGIPDGLTCAHLSAALRSELARNCTEFPLTISSPGGFDIAMATRGGIALEAVNHKTMESTIIPVFFAGEVLDIDGDTGGYNLQAAFSTGHLAAHGIIKRMKH